MTTEPAVSPSPSDIRRWRRYLADERAEAAVYRALAGRRTGEERALVLGVSASGVATHVVLLTGISGLLAGALSMGAGEYVSVRSQRELLEASIPNPAARTALPDLDVDANELTLVYRARGMTPEEA